MDKETPSISIVVPAYNEADGLEVFHARLADVLAGLPMRAEIVYVNDGSTDSTLSVMRALRRRDPRVRVLDLSRNFGKEIALTAGIDHARGDALVLIDSDLQDPPALIPEFVRLWLQGHDVVYAQRLSRHGESLVKKLTAHAFYRLIKGVSQVRIPEDTGDFRLMSRRAVDALKQLREQHRFMKGLFAWIGYAQVAVPYHRDARFAGKTKWNYWKLWNFAIEGITSFSTAPLKISTYFGLTVAALAFGMGLWFLAKTVLYGEAVRGFPTLIVTVLFLGGTQLVAIGILGEYIGRMFDESKHRPLYFLNSHDDAAERIGHSPADPSSHLVECGGLQRTPASSRSAGTSGDQH